MIEFLDSLIYEQWWIVAYLDGLSPSPRFRDSPASALISCPTGTSSPK